MVESLCVGREELDAAGNLRVVQECGAVMCNIDTGAFAARNVKVLALRGRFNVARAEHALVMMPTLAKKLQSASLGCTPAVPTWRGRIEYEDHRVEVGGQASARLRASLIGPAASGSCRRTKCRMWRGINRRGHCQCVVALGDLAKPTMRRKAPLSGLGWC